MYFGNSSQRKLDIDELIQDKEEYDKQDSIRKLRNREGILV